MKMLHWLIIANDFELRVSVFGVGFLWSSWIRVFRIFFSDLMWIIEILLVSAALNLQIAQIQDNESAIVVELGL